MGTTTYQTHILIQYTCDQNDINSSTAQNACCNTKDLTSHLKIWSSPILCMTWHLLEFFFSFFCLFCLFTVGVQGYCCARSHSLTLGRIPLDERSARRRNPKHSQETDIYAAGGIRTCHPNKRAPVDPRGHRDRRCTVQCNSLIHHTFPEEVQNAKFNV
jgi:hypothetical protein